MSLFSDVLGIKKIGKGYGGPSLSFPSALNRGKNSLHIIDEGNGMTSLKAAPILALNKESFTRAYRDRIPSMNINTDEDIKTNLLYTPQTYRFDRFPNFSQEINIGYPDPNLHFENPYQLGGDAIRSMNWYRFKYHNKLKNKINSEKSGNSSIETVSNSAITPSLFNPKFGILSKGITWNTPLLYDMTDDQYKAEDTSDCTIRKLIQLSNAGKLGAQRYRLADFMYCKDLGKVPNNHLITLRKFAFPVGDVIGEAVAPNYAAAVAQEPGYMVGDDVARLITWFDTDDNKLEDILNYEYKYTWKEVNSDRQDLPSQENDPSRGFVGLFNNLNAGNFRHMSEGTSGPHNLWSKILGGNIESFNMTPDSSRMDQYRKYDNNKVYTAKQRTQKMFIPEGKLEFNHEFSLTFSYKLRAYDNINPRSAMLDLLGNILECTYFRGSWWEGEQNIVGPKPNNGSFYKVNAFLDNAWDKVGGVLSAMAAGTDTFSSLLGILSSIAGEGLNMITNMANKAMGGALEAAQASAKEGKTGQALAQIINGLWKNAGLGEFAKAGCKNALGRPAFYAFDSLLTGEDTGLWHVTIGNPRNPIVSIGNLIMKSATVQHLGPLGIDDFPTEIKVKVTLSHGRSRDLTQISKMYTQGLSSIYHTTARHKWTDFYPDYPETAGSYTMHYTDVDKEGNEHPGVLENNTTLSGVDLDKARADQRAANKDISVAASDDGKSASVQGSSGNGTDQYIAASQFQNRTDFETYSDNATVLLNSPYETNAALVGTNNLIQAQIIRDEYS